MAPTKRPIRGPTERGCRRPDARRYSLGQGTAMAIDPKLPIPVYFQLKTLLLEEILDGR
jgi:hypothetical protein